MDKLPAKKGDRDPRPIGGSDWSRIGTSIRRCNPPVPPYPCFSPWHCRGLSFPRRGATFRVASLRSSLRIRPSLARIDMVHKRRASPAYQPPRMLPSHATPLSPMREYPSDRDARSGRSLGIHELEKTNTCRGKGILARIPETRHGPSRGQYRVGCPAHLASVCTDGRSPETSMLLSPASRIRQGQGVQPCSNTRRRIHWKELEGAAFYKMNEALRRLPGYPHSCLMGQSDALLAAFGYHRVHLGCRALYCMGFGRGLKPRLPVCPSAV
jgi:hypothetical protein